MGIYDFNTVKNQMKQNLATNKIGGTKAPKANELVKNPVAPTTVAPTNKYAELPEYTGHSGIGRAVWDVMRQKREDENSQQRQKDLIASQEGEINKFESNMPKYADIMESDLLSNAKQKISKGQSEIAKSANRRGLLYSGVKEGEQADYAGEVTAQTSQQMADVQEILESRRQEMRDRLASYRLGKYEQEVAEADSAYKRALGEYQSGMQLTGTMLGAGGLLIGGLK